MSAISDVIENKLNNGDNVLIIAVGDSITWGLNHCSPEETFCAELARCFAKHFSDISVFRYDGIAGSGSKPMEYYEGPIKVSTNGKQTLTIVRSGIGGNTVKKGLARLDDYTGSFITGEYPDVFLIMFGINDALFEDQNKYVTPDVYYSDLKEMYSLIKLKNPDARIVFMTPTYNDPGTSVKSCLDTYSDKMKQLSEETNSYLIDTHKLWMEHCRLNSDNYGQGDWLSGVEDDSCHFSPVGSIETGRFIFNSLMGKVIV